MTNYYYHVQRYYDEYATCEEKADIDKYYLNNNVKQLRAIAKQKKIPQYSYSCKDELCLMIVKNDTIGNICNMW
tara:strand:+ start:1029 stop:1250 length:222 start_codon:yes stop_codon:yes gene_type:complete